MQNSQFPNYDGHNSGSNPGYQPQGTNAAYGGNVSLAVLGGFLAALVGAVIWALITALTKYQIGYMAIGVGFLVGISVRLLGKGDQPIFGIIGAVFALLGCAIGNFLAIVIFTAGAEGLSIWDLLAATDFNILIEVMVETFQFMDVLFYGLAIYAGYKFALAK